MQIVANMISILTIYFDQDVGFMVFNATFNNISVISWRSVLLVDKTGVPGVPGENHRPATSHSRTLSRNVVHLALSGIRVYFGNCEKTIFLNFFLCFIL